jgi:hypothetical protein
VEDDWYKPSDSPAWEQLEDQLKQASMPKNPLGTGSGTPVVLRAGKKRLST